MIQQLTNQAGSMGTTVERFMNLLRQPAANQQRATKVDCIETHISWVFLTDRFAYKLKKPVRFDFLDFSTVDLRERACRDELRLNRRLAKGVYLDVVPVSLVGNRVRFGLGGKVIDWVVKMRRLPADRALDRLIQSHSLPQNDVDQIGRVLAEFYFQLPPVTMRTDGYVDGIAQHVLRNEQELLKPTYKLDVAMVERVHESQRQYMTFARDTLQNRVLDGRIVEGHGDLRPEHIYLTPDPVIIDCIEFNREYRILDVVDELAFLAMECAKLGASGMGRKILETYCSATGDNPSPELVAFYSTYRACVRAKVCALRAEQLSGDQRDTLLGEARHYLDLADEFARRLGPPLLIIVRGLSGSGKSTLADAIAGRFGITHLQTDAIRSEVLGEDRQTSGYGQGCYDLESRQLVYNELLRRAGALLRQGKSVVLDGTFLRSQWRSQAFALATQLNITPAFVHCECPETVALERISDRAVAGPALSDAREDIFKQQQREVEPDPQGVETIVADTTIPVAIQVDKLVEALNSRRYQKS